MIRIVRDDIGDQFSFLLEVFILKNEGVIAVLRHLTRSASEKRVNGAMLFAFRWPLY